MHYFKINRLYLLITIVVIFINLSFSRFVNAEEEKTLTVQEKLAHLEVSSGGLIGVSAINTANNTKIQYRANERFPTGCTSKVIGVAAILKKSMSHNSLLAQRIYFAKNDLTNWNPITEKHIIDGMTISELSAAAISFSDNTAMNLLVKKLGGVRILLESIWLERKNIRACIIC
jgi:beta-lactamase class A